MLVATCPSILLCAFVPGLSALSTSTFPFLMPRSSAPLLASVSAMLVLELSAPPSFTLVPMPSLFAPLSLSAVPLLKLFASSSPSIVPVPGLSAFLSLSIVPLPGSLTPPSLFAVPAPYPLNFSTWSSR